MPGIVCPLCGVSTSFNPAGVPVPEYVHDEPMYVEAVVHRRCSGPPIRGLSGKAEGYAILECQGCKGLFVAQETLNSEWNPVYPIARKVVSDRIPELIRNEFREACVCLFAAAYRSCVAMCGITLEHIWNEQKASGLKDLLEREGISKRLFKRADEVRLWGNLIKHNPLPETVLKEDAEQVIGYLEILLYELYVEPSELDTLTGKRENLKKKL